MWQGSQWIRMSACVCVWQMKRCNVFGKNKARLVEFDSHCPAEQPRLENISNNNNKANRRSFFFFFYKTIFFLQPLGFWMLRHDEHVPDIVTLMLHFLSIAYWFIIVSYTLQLELLAPANLWDWQSECCSCCLSFGALFVALETWGCKLNCPSGINKVESGI